MVELVYSNDKIRMQLAEQTDKRTTIVDDVSKVMEHITKSGISEEDARKYINDNFLNLLSEFISGGIISRTVKEIGTTPEYYKSPERREGSGEKETTFTLTKELKVRIGEIYPYIDVTVNACSIDMMSQRFDFKVAGDISLKNPSITVCKGNIIRAALGTITPSLTVYYVTKGGEDKKLYTLSRPVTFREVELTGCEFERNPDRTPRSAVA